MEEFLSGIMMGFLKTIGLYLGCHLVAQAGVYSKTFSARIGQRCVLSFSVLALAAFPAAMAADSKPSMSFDYLWGQYIALLFCVAVWFPKLFAELFQSLSGADSTNES